MFATELNFVVVLSANFLIQTSCNRIRAEHAVIPCLSDATCSTDLPGSQCVDFQCICMVKNGCKPHKIRSVSNQVGERCLTDEDCLVEHSKCSINGSCECLKGWLPTHDKKKCIDAVPKPLGSKCIDSAQCAILNAECKDNTCQCAENRHSKDGICYESKALGEQCTNSKQCSTLHSRCTGEVCRCKDGFMIHENDCLQPAKTISSHCYDNVQCTITLGEGSQCLQSACTCMDQYIYQEDGSKCMKISEPSSAIRSAPAISLLCLVLLLSY